MRLILLLLIAMLSYVNAYKYFIECKENVHIDIRYAKCNETIDREEMDTTKYDLTRVWFQNIIPYTNISSWLIHGGLIGWRWNKKPLPWDPDIDVQMSLDSTVILSSYNRTVWGHNDRTYLLDINPHYTNRNHTDGLNIIDARLISQQNGLYIDITMVGPCSKSEGKICAKDSHIYSYDDIFPLKYDTLYDINIIIPNLHDNILIKEYGKKSIDNPNYTFIYKKNNKRERENWKFNSVSDLWELNTDLRQPVPHSHLNRK
jgi:hypothetical protein